MMHGIINFTGKKRRRRVKKEKKGKNDFIYIILKILRDIIMSIKY